MKNLSLNKNIVGSPDGADASLGRMARVIHDCRYRVASVVSGARRFLPAYLDAGREEISKQEDASAFRDPMTSLAAEADELDALSREIEAGFLSLGASLEKLPDASENLVKRSERLVALASGDEPGAQPYQDLLRGLEAPLAFFDSSQQTFESLAVRLLDAINQIDQMTRMEAQLNRAVAPLAYIQTIFKIESAPLSFSIQQMFLALTEDIERLHRQVSQTFGEKFDMLRGVRATLLSVHEGVVAYTTNEGRLLSERRHQVQRAVSSLVAELDQKVARNMNLTNTTRMISQEAGRLVVGLQAQDIVNQKLAHVRSALMEVEKLPPCVNLEARDGSGMEDLAFRAASCRLQAAQIEAVALDLNDAWSAIGKSTGTIEGHIHKIDDECLCLSDYEKVVADANGLIQILLETIGEVRNMVRKTLASAETAFNAVQSVGGLATNLTVVMRQISIQIHIIALNAQVQAAHNCGGTGLEVLAMNTALISQETAAINESVASGVDALTVDLHNMVQEFGRLRDEAMKWRATMDTEGAGHEEWLHGIRDSTLNELLAAADGVSDVTSLIQGMEKQDMFSAATARLKKVQAAVGRAADEAAARLRQLGADTSLERFAGRLSGAYSVASEHEVLRRVFGLRTEKPSGGDALLFGNEAPGELPRAGTEPPDGQGGGLGQTTVAGAAVADGGKAEPMGDNVELF